MGLSIRKVSDTDSQIRLSTAAQAGTVQSIRPPQSSGAESSSAQSNAQLEDAANGRYFLLVLSPKAGRALFLYTRQGTIRPISDLRSAPGSGGSCSLRKWKPSDSQVQRAAAGKHLPILENGTKKCASMNRLIRNCWGTICSKRHSIFVYRRTRRGLDYAVGGQNSSKHGCRRVSRKKRLKKAQDNSPGGHWQ